MAIFTRIHGDAEGVNNSDAQGHVAANASIVSTGIQGGLTAYKITGLGVTNLVPESNTGGGVETLLRKISERASLLAFQVDANGQLSVLVERNGWHNDATLLAALPTGNIGAVSNVYVGGGTAVSSTGGIKLA